MPLLDGQTLLGKTYSRAIVLPGIGEVLTIINGDKEILLRTDECAYIPAGHRLENPGVIPLVMIEVQSGDYVGEDDIVRFENNGGCTKSVKAN